MIWAAGSDLYEAGSDLYGALQWLWGTAVMFRGAEGGLSPIHTHGGSDLYADSDLSGAFFAWTAAVICRLYGGRPTHSASHGASAFV